MSNKKNTESLRHKAEESIQNGTRKLSGKNETVQSEGIERILYELQVHQIELEMQNEELRRTQLNLERSQKSFSDLYNKAPVGYCTLSTEGIILEANTTLSTLLDIPHDTLIKQPFSRFVFSEDQDLYYLYRKKFFATERPQSCELRLLMNDGTQLWAYLASNAVKEDDNTMVVHLAISDISERKRMEEELHHKDRMMLAQSRQAAMGEILSMIAHQWRQPLNIIGLAIANIETKRSLQLLDESEFDDHTATITKNISYMSDTIDDFRNFFVPTLSKERVTMENIILNITAIMGQALRNHDITLNIENHTKTALLINKNSLIQALMTLLNNAKDVLMENKVPSPAITITATETKEKMMITIGDNGGGISEAIIDEIGQPYFTTKELNGTGLGLYIAQTIIEKHFGGTLTWDNKDQGALFVITLKI